VRLGNDIEAFRIGATSHVPCISLNGHHAARIEILCRLLIGPSFRFQNRLVYHPKHPHLSIDKAAREDLVRGGS